MNIVQAIEKFRNEKTVVNVQTEQEWVEFMKLLEDHSDIKWCSGFEPTLVNKWRQHEEDSCIRIQSYLSYASKQYYRCLIITFQDFKKLYQNEQDMKQFTKSALKDYMKVVLRNGEERIVKGGILSNDCGDAVISQVLTNGLTWVFKDQPFPCFDIVEVYEPTLWGWSLLWSREEPKYMLLFPTGMFGTNSKLVKFRKNYNWVEASYVSSESAKCAFTQAEIDAIPFNTGTFTPVPVG